MKEKMMKYETHSEAFHGVSKIINESNCPASWKDIFVFNDQRGRGHIVPACGVALSESGSGEIQ